MRLLSLFAVERWTVSGVVSYCIFVLCNCGNSTVYVIVPPKENENVTFIVRQLCLPEREEHYEHLAANILQLADSFLHVAVIVWWLIRAGFLHLFLFCSFPRFILFLRYLQHTNISLLSHVFSVMKMVYSHTSKQWPYFFMYTNCRRGWSVIFSRYDVCSYTVPWCKCNLCLMHSGKYWQWLVEE